MKSHNILKMSVILPLLTLAGCSWFAGEQKKEATATPSSSTAVKTDVPTGEVLLTIDGKTSITAPEFQEELDQFLELQPHYRQLLSLMPNAKQQIFASIKAERVLDEWISRNKVDQKADYQKDLALINKLGRRQLAIKYFTDAFPATVSAAEVKKFYEEKKTVVPEFTQVRGGVNAQGVAFDTEALAKEFLDKARAAGADFAKIAKDSNLTLKDFKNVTAQSFDLEGSLRDKILEAKKFPAVLDVIKVTKGPKGKTEAKDQFWVVSVISKQEPKYIPFDEVKERIEAYLKEEQKGKVVTTELEKLEKEYNVVENKDFFERERVALEKEQQEKMAALTKTAKQEGTTAQQAQKPVPAAAPVITEVKGAV